MTSKQRPIKYPALGVRQWLPEWGEVSFKESEQPLHKFFMLSLPATTLRALSGIYRRDQDTFAARHEDLGIQRYHDKKRSDEIARYLRVGYPYSTFTDTQRTTAVSKGANYQKPGWLSTAIVVNILRPGEIRQGFTLDENDALTSPDDLSTFSPLYDFFLPATWEESEWKPKGIPPIEIIDGQHRLFAFNQDDDDFREFDLPVVAFYGLNIEEQAYLFWTINIKPKKINASLAFDLYPLLREQDWLIAGENLQLYRETRSQELTEALWATPGNPWFRRINMLGETGLRHEKPVTQAAFVRSIAATFVRPRKDNEDLSGGLFGGFSSGDGSLGWSRVQQAGVLAIAWKYLNDAIANTSAEWAQRLKEAFLEQQYEVFEPVDFVDPAFASAQCLLASDQGVRATLAIFNDFLLMASRELELDSWRMANELEELPGDLISQIESQPKLQPALHFLRDLCDGLASYDWRNSKAEFGGDDDEKRKRLVFRGSSGYKELRRQLIVHLSKCGFPDIEGIASRIGSR